MHKNKHTHHNKQTTHTTHTTDNTTNNITRNQEVFEEFVFDEVRVANITLSKVRETNLADLKIRVDADDFVLLTATVGWKPNAEDVTVIFRIRRDGTEIVSTRDSAEQEDPQIQTFRTTSFSWVDKPGSGKHHYVLTAQVITGAATVVGPIVLTATEIEG
jgi:hypothetical protein